MSNTPKPQFDLSQFPSVPAGPEAAAAPTVSAAPAPAAAGSLQLGYAPPARSRKRPPLVIIAGLFTTALVLLGVYLLEAYADENVMGWYANYVIPVGGILVGLVASSGYGIASWVTGVKIQRWLLGLIVVLQVFAFFEAHYIEFRSHGTLVYKATNSVVTFPQYFHLQTVNMQWKSDKTRDYRGNAVEEDKPLGNLGYLVRLGELLGFVGGSLIVPISLLQHPYCELCQLYMKRKSVAWIAASESGGFMPKLGKAKEARNQLNQQTFEHATATLTDLCQSAQGGDVAGFKARVAELPKARKARNKPARYHLQLVRCKCCSSGHLAHSLIVGQGRSQKVQAKGTVPVTPQFIRSYMGLPNGAEMGSAQ